MMAWLSHYLKGYLKMRVRGRNPERFFNLCGGNGIEIWKLSCKGQEYFCCITVKSFRLIKPLAKKSGVRLNILEKSGLPFFLFRNRKRKLFFGGLAIFAVILYMMSLFIWDIEFEGNTAYTADTLLKFFETQEIYFGMEKKNVDCDVIEEVLRSEFSEITWVSARVSGTRLLVKIKENEVLSSVPQPDDSPCDVTASKAGVITKMVVRRGVPKVKIGDTVEEGQVLISGLLPITNDGEEIVNVHQVRADADIYARTEQTYTKTIDKLHQVQVKTGKTRNGIYLNVLGHSLTLISPKPKDTTWEMVMEEKQAKLFQNFYLPLYGARIEGEEYVTYERFYTEEEQNQLANTVHHNFMENLMEKGVQILENNVKILDNESKFQIVGQFTVEENIGRIQTIAEPEEINKPDERSGNDY